MTVFLCSYLEILLLFGIITPNMFMGVIWSLKAKLKN